MGATLQKTHYLICIWHKVIQDGSRVNSVVHFCTLNIFVKNYALHSNFPVDFDNSGMKTLIYLLVKAIRMKILDSGPRQSE